MQLQERGVDSLTPDLPNATMPKLKEWLQTAESSVVELGEYSTDNMVVTGRSLGCTAALKYAEKNKLRKLVLVCPTSLASFAKDEAAFAANKSDLTKDQLEMFREFIANEGKPDFNKIRENVGEVVIFLSTDDPYIPLEETKDYFVENLPQARVITMRDSGHFTGERGYAQFPQLLSEVLAPVRLDIYKAGFEQLPVTLPEDVDYRPKGTAPLATSQEFDASIEAEEYGEKNSDILRREVDTMDTFVCSSWYFFRFIDPDNPNRFADPKKLKAVGPVDFYMGGAEHTVLHLLYARFFTKVLYDAGIIDYKEPFLKLRHQGLILGPDSRKMSKRWGNVIDPNDIVEEYGADTLRMYEMFMGPIDQMKPWSEGGVKGVHRFLHKVWDLHEQLLQRKFAIEDEEANNRLRIELNTLLQSTSEAIQSLSFNTAVSDFMKFINLAIDKDGQIDKQTWKVFVQLLNPFAPFITAEMWQAMDSGDIELMDWPQALETVEPEEELITVVAMVDGKVRDQLQVHKGTQKSTLLELAKESESVQKFVGDFSAVKKVIFVPDKLINIVT
jgi:leucyl-tRNA synthetase